jgi:hypothetical protein
MSEEKTVKILFELVVHSSENTPFIQYEYRSKFVKERATVSFV